MCAGTSWPVIAVERDDRSITDPNPSFTFAAGDGVVVAGPDAGIDEPTALVGD